MRTDTPTEPLNEAEAALIDELSPSHSSEALEINPRSASFLSRNRVFRFVRGEWIERPLSSEQRTPWGWMRLAAQEIEFIKLSIVSLPVQVEIYRRLARLEQFGKCDIRRKIQGIYPGELDRVRRWAEALPNAKRKR